MYATNPNRSNLIDTTKLMFQGQFGQLHRIQWMTLCHPRVCPSIFVHSKQRNLRVFKGSGPVTLREVYGRSFIGVLSTICDFCKRISTVREAPFNASDLAARWEVSRLLAQIKGLAHVLPVKGANVEILSTPTDFFHTLLDGIGKAEERLTIGSLYIGTGGGRTASVVDALGAAAQDVKKRPGLKISVLMDGSRGTRASLDPDGIPTSSAERLRKAMLKGADCTERTRIALYQTPAMRGLLKKVLPPRVREVVSVCHVKAYIFDDNILLSGANLSSTYFTQRQDRYVLIKKSKELADQMDALVNALADFSYILGPQGALMGCPAKADPMKQPMKFRDMLWKRIAQIFFPANSPLFHWRAPYSRAVQHSGTVACDSMADTWVVPVVQLAHFHIHQDEYVTKRLILATKPGGYLQLASAYLNLALPFQRALMKCHGVNLEILTASPEANGFFGAKGVSGFVPTAYSLVMARLWKKLCAPNPRTPEGIVRHIMEYGKPGWQFHAKGIWYTPPGDDFPLFTAVGSPNFGHRSVYRDIESQVMLFTVDPELRQRLGQEVSALKEHSVEVQEENLVELERRTGVAGAVAVRLVQGFL